MPGLHSPLPLPPSLLPPSPIPSPRPVSAPSLLPSPPFPSVSLHLGSHAPCTRQATYGRGLTTQVHAGSEDSNAAALSAQLQHALGPCPEEEAAGR